MFGFEIEKAQIHRDADNPVAGLNVVASNFRWVVCSRMLRSDGDQPHFCEFGILIIA